MPLDLLPVICVSEDKYDGEAAATRTKHRFARADRRREHGGSAGKSEERGPA